MGLEELVLRIRMGDKSAVKDLISIYGNAVYLRAFERTQDKELAREAARQTFGQFVAVVQQQPDGDGWSRWFGDLIERNISAYAQIGPDMSLIEDELGRELYGQRWERKEQLLAQLEFQLEELETNAGEDELLAEMAATSTRVEAFARKRPSRQPFPDHLPRERVWCRRRRRATAVVPPACPRSAR